MWRPANNNFAFTPVGRRRTGNDRGSSSPDDHEEQLNGHAVVPWTPRLRSDEGGNMFAPWRLFEERVRTGPFGLSRFPSQPHSPVRILVLDAEGSGGAVDPALRQFIRDSPPRIRGEWHLAGPAGFSEPTPEEPGLSDEDFKKAMKKLRRHVHNPTYPRRWAWKRGLFSSRTKADVEVAEEKEEGEEDKDSCAICLEAFGPNEQVMATPCNHMFHHGCIAPWVRSRGECPVCRFALCEAAAAAQQRLRRRETALAAAPRVGTGSGFYYGNAGGNGNGGGGMWDPDLYYLVRAMEEAFNWVNVSR
uniref:RING-type E3 ubiquitin transferase n=1 Tax=Anthurium amnicola TaxID=1678845 RepID=A0A1D1YH91_9ARAE